MLSPTCDYLAALMIDEAAHIVERYLAYSEFFLDGIVCKCIQPVELAIG
jgi:hypothetical protein